MHYEYTVLAAPSRGEKSRGAKSPTDRFALSLTGELNRMAAEGWEYVRAETLPSEERSGLTGRATLYHNLLVFRRPAGPAARAPEPATAETPAVPAPAVPAPKAEPALQPAEQPGPAAPQDSPARE